MPDYDEWFREFLEMTDQTERVREYFHHNMDVLGLRPAQSCISIGPGQGDIDGYLVQHCMPNLEHYTAVDPDDALLEDLKTCVTSARPDLNYTFIKSKVEKWKGPQEKVDIIFLINMLYHVHDRVSLFGRCKEWLTENGTAIIIIEEEGNITNRISMNFGNPIDLCRAPHIRADLHEAGIGAFSDKTLPVHLDIRNPTDNFVCFMINRRPSPAEFDEIRQYIKQQEPNGVASIPECVITFDRRG